MKKIILMMVAALTMTTAMAKQADGKPTKKMTHQEMTTQMTSKLKLNDAQKAKVAALNKEYQDVLMQEPTQKPDCNKTKAKKVNGKNVDNKKANAKKPAGTKNNAKRQEYEKKLKKILTDKQYKNYQKMQPTTDKKSGKMDNK